MEGHAAQACWPIRQGSFEHCLGVDVDSLQTCIPHLLNLPLCPGEREHDIVEGIVVRPSERQPLKNWCVKKKSWRYLESSPNELQKACEELKTNPDSGFERLYLSFCVEARLDAVLSKDPQLLMNPVDHDQIADLDHLTIDHFQRARRSSWCLEQGPQANKQAEKHRCCGWSWAAS